MKNKRPLNIILIGIGLAVAYWILESLLGTFVFKTGSFTKELIPADPYLIWTRLIVIGLIIIFGIYAQYIVNKQKQTEEALRESEEEYRTLAENINVGVYRNTVGTKGKFIEFNPAMVRMFGYKNKEDFYNMNVADLYLHPEDRKTFNAKMLRDGFVSNEELQLKKKDGTPFVGSVSAVAVKDENGDVKHYDGIIEDITERKRMEEQLIHMATHDRLTGLPNRELLSDRLSVAIAYAERYSQKIAVMMLDLDYFKEVNDSMGHGAGDMLLKIISERLTKILRKSDTIARMGGDEFILLLPEIISIANATTIANKVLKAIGEPYEIEDRKLHITISIGIAIYPKDGQDIEMLIRNADYAMYSAKNKGRNNYQLYTPTRS